MNRTANIFLSNSKMDGIHANNLYRANLPYETLQIRSNLFLGVHAAGMQRPICQDSICIYRRGHPQPISEEYPPTGKFLASTKCA
jgi:GDP-L-fucose synthase